MHARMHEIAHMNQEVFQSFEDIQLEIKSLQDDFKSINEWSQTSGNKYGDEIQHFNTDPYFLAGYEDLHRRMKAEWTGKEKMS